MKNTKDKTSDSRKKCKHIDDSERQIIEKLSRKGQSVVQIADSLGFHRSTIYRELQRGKVIHLNSQLEEYVTYSADRASDEAHLRASSHGPSLKIGNDFARTQLFYAHPYCASERGSNENANRLIRRFLPKGNDFTSLSQKDSVHLAMWMNKYPRKLHDGSSAWQLSKVYSYHFNRISV